MSLPLTVRKAIRDAEPKSKEYLEKIEAATGKQFSLEVDWAAAFTATKSDQIGSLYQNDVLSRLSSNIEKLCKDEMCKEAFEEATSQNKIIIRPNDKIPGYWIMKFENGALVIEHKNSIANVHEVEYFAIERVLPTPGLPLPVRQNIEANRERLQENLERIGTATGNSDWQLEMDIEKIHSQLDKSIQEQIGSSFYDQAMSRLACNIEKTVQNETVKESFNEATNQHKIVIELVDKWPKGSNNGYHTILFENGNLVIRSLKNWANVHEIEYFELERVIPSPGMSLIVRLNLEKYRPKLEEYLEEIGTATGESGWSLETDFDKTLPQLEKNSQESIGSIYYDQAMSRLTSNLKTSLADEMTREAFNEATTQRKIIIRVNDKNPQYWKIIFENGSLVIEHKKNVANVHEVEYFDIKAVMPVPGVLSLLARLSISSNKEKLDESLEQIKEATGEEYTFDDSCIEAIYPKLSANDQTNIGQIIAQNVMTRLASNLTKALKDDMVKEAFNEVATSHQITIKVDTNPKANKYWVISFENGNIVLTCLPSLANVHEVEYFDIEKIL